jgi:hypothetical protein
VGFLKTFGCLGFVKDKHSGLKKLEDRSAPMVFIGYSKGAKVYRMLDPGTGHVHTSCDIIFDESRGWRWDSEDGDDKQVASQDITIRFSTSRAPEVVNNEIEHHGGSPSPPPDHNT